MVQASSAADAASGLRVLRERNFRWFFLGQCASMLGDGMVAPALAFAILNLTGHVSDLGLVLAAGTAAQVLFMLAGGVIADWLPRNALMLGSDLLRTVSQGITAVLLITGSARIWQLLVLQVVHGMAAAMFVPAVPGHPGHHHPPTSDSRPTPCVCWPCPGRSSRARPWRAFSSSPRARAGRSPSTR